MKTKTIHETREQWLTAAVEMFRRDIDLQILLMEDSDKEIAFPNEDGERDEQWPPALPEKLRVSCSNPATGINNRILGQWVSPSCSFDGTHEIWISPKLEVAESVLLVLLHELIHATLEAWQPGAGHGPRFWRMAKPLGFARPLTQPTIATTEAGQILRRSLGIYEAQLGAYPHAGVNIRAHETNRKRQSTRMMKAECMTDGCGFKVRISRTWAAQATPLCPCCEGLGIHSRTVVSMTEGPDLCRLAGQDVRADGTTDAEAVQAAATMRAEREERERLAQEAAEAARIAERAAAAARQGQDTGQRAASMRAAGLGDAADLGVVQGQGLQNRYGLTQEQRRERAARRESYPAPSFAGVDQGRDTTRHLMDLALPGCLVAEPRPDLNEVEDAVIRYCDSNQIKIPGRFKLAEAWRVVEVQAPNSDQDEPGQPTTKVPSVRFANLELD